jgi:NAD(P)-dependent dehydrogenase (short-subunit alcohol dehydrogenase family)
VVTGAGQNVGAGIARALAAQGATVHVNDIVEARAEQTVEQITSAGGSAATASFDVTDYDAVTDAIASIGTVDILVNNAGIVRDKTLLKMDESDFDSVVEVHLKGTFNCTRHAAEVMKEKGYGRIVNITSSAGLRGNFGQTNYGAAKAGIMGMTFVWSMELGRYGITVNAVAPAGATRMTAALYERSGKEPPPEENPALNAPLVAFLASEGSAHVNGQILGRTEYAYTLFQHPKQVAWMWKDGGWSAAEVAEKFDATLGQHVQPVGMVMPKSMEK